MWDKIWIDKEGWDTRNNWSEGLEQLLKKANEQGIKILEGPDYPSTGEQENCLMFVDNEEDIRYGKEQDIALLTYQNPGTSFSQQVPLVVEGWEEVDVAFCKGVYERHHKIPWEILTTSRCKVREMSCEDAEAMWELYQPEEMSRYVSYLPKDPKEAKAYLNAYVDTVYKFYEVGMWAVVEESSGHIIGQAGLEPTELEGEVWLLLGYAIGIPWQGQGFATEVCRKILEYGKTRTEGYPIGCLIDPENENSLKVARKLGFLGEKKVFFQGKYRLLFYL